MEKIALSINEASHLSRLRSVVQYISKHLDDEGIGREVCCVFSQWGIFGLDCLAHEICSGGGCELRVDSVAYWRMRECWDGIVKRSSGLEMLVYGGQCSQAIAFWGRLCIRFRRMLNLVRTSGLSVRGREYKEVRRAQTVRGCRNQMVRMARVIISTREILPGMKDWELLPFRKLSRLSLDEKLQMEQVVRAHMSQKRWRELEHENRR